MSGRDIFGGQLDPSKQPDPETGHFLVAIGTDLCHCMRCMIGEKYLAEKCPLHPPVGHPGGPTGRDVVSDRQLMELANGSLAFEDFDRPHQLAIVHELLNLRRSESLWRRTRADLDALRMASRNAWHRRARALLSRALDRIRGNSCTNPIFRTTTETSTSST